MKTPEILARFRGLTALVIGDICLDRWCTYDPEASDTSRETGIGRIGVVETRVTPGAGGTVANNLAALGAGRVAVLGAIGQDGHGFELKSALSKRGIEPDLLIESFDLQTFTYTKLLNARTGEEDRPRVDFINQKPLPERLEAAIVERLAEHAPRFNVILVSDQAETAVAGVVSKRLRHALASLAAEMPEKVFWVDSRLRPELFRGVIVKPNREEADAACERMFGRIDYDALRCQIGAPFLPVTHGPGGVLLIEARGERWVRTRPIERPVDICGAGDSFSAGAALTLAVTGSAELAARIGNLVASVTVMKRGTGTASPAEVLAAEQARA